MLKPNFMLEGEFIQHEKLLTSKFTCRRNYSRGETVIGLSDDRSKYCYYILEGRVSFKVINVDGRSHISTMRGVGSIFPLYYTFDSTSVERTLEVCAVLPTSLLVIPKNELRELMMERPEVALSMIDAYAKYVTYTNYEIETQLFDSIQTRLANFIFLHADANGIVHATHEDISYAIGATRANVSRAISEFRKAGIVETLRGSMRVVRFDRLCDYCSYVSGSDEVGNELGRH